MHPYIRGAGKQNLSHNKKGYDVEKKKYNLWGEKSVLCSDLKGHLCEEVFL